VGWRAASQPEDKAALAAAYAWPPGRRNVTLWPWLMRLRPRQRNGVLHPARAWPEICCARYSQGESPEKALDLLAVNEFRNAAYVENLGKSKSISFYDSGLLGDMAYAHLACWHCCTWSRPAAMPG